MMRGDIANVLVPTLWIHSDVVLEYKGRWMKIGKKQYQLKNESWLWGVSYILRPVIIYIDEKPNSLLSDYDHMTFDTLIECRDALRCNQRAVEMVVTDPNMVSHDIVLYTPSLQRYC
mgnify:CR=1 FL=1